MTVRILTTLGLAAAVAVVACVDMSAPPGPASISLLLLPSPSVVVGDVMRDSNGAPAPLSIIAYDAKGTPLTTAAAQFYVADTLHFVHIDASNIVVGDKLGTARIIGQVGNLQTAAVSVPVTYAPDHIVIPTIVDSITVPVGADSASSMGTLTLPVAVQSVADSAAQGFIVHYTITHAPATLASATSPAVYLANDLGKITSADTSDASGQANPRLVVNSLLLATPNIKDSVVIEASAKYNGVLLKGSPLRFIVQIGLLFR